MMNRTQLVACVATIGLAACRSEPPPEPVAPTVAVEAAPAPAQPTGMFQAGHDVFGMALPSGVRLEDQREGIKHYRAEGEFSDLLNFFDIHLAGAWTLTRFDRGARLVSDDGSGRAIYMYRETAREPWLLSYFESPDATGIGGDETFAVPRDNPNWAASLEARFGSEIDEMPIGGGSLGAPSAGAPASGLTAPGPVNVRLHSGGNPRLRDRVGLEQAQTPINFVRGIREEKRNPDALF